MFESQNKIKTRLQHHGSIGGVVQAHFENVEQAACFVTFAQSGTDFIITSFGVAPGVTTKQAQLAGEACDVALEQEAAKLGVKQLFIIHQDDTAELVRTYTPQPFVLGVGVTSSRHTYIN